LAGLPGVTTVLVMQELGFFIFGMWEQFFSWRNRNMKRTTLNQLLRASVVLLLLTLPHRSFAVTIDFETLADGDVVTNQFPDILFSNATVLTAGISLNEFEFPPKSGSNVVFDDGGPMTLSFLTPVLGVSGFFTYLSLSPLTLSAFDPSGNLLASVSSAFSNNTALSGEGGSSPNEQLGFFGLGLIGSLTISGDAGGGSFVVDDITLTPIPEPGTMLLLGSGLLALLGRRVLQRRSEVNS
jgi:hypothetical protein